MGEADTAPSRRSRYTQEWLESALSPSATASEPVADIQDEAGLAARLYSSCLAALRDLSPPEPAKATQSVSVHEELTKLYLWGQGFARGELDMALEYSEDTRHMVLDALGNIGRLLLRGKILRT